MPDHEQAGQRPARAGPVPSVDAEDTSQAASADALVTRTDVVPTASTGLPVAVPAVRPRARRLPGFARRWLAIFAGSLGLFIIRFLVPTPVGQADNHDGKRVMCAFGVAPVTGGHRRWISYAYFQFAPSASCAKLGVYPTSQLVPLEAARLLTPLLGLPGTVNLIALGLLTCAIASFGIASLAVGLRLRLWAQLGVAAAAWLIMADAAFFDLYASPFSEPAVLIGLLLVAAGVVYLCRGWHEAVFGLVLVGVGGCLAILAKEQYVILVVPICLTVILAGATRDRGRRLRGFLTRQTGAAVAVAAFLTLLSAGYLYWGNTSSYAAALQHQQAVDMIFGDIVNGHDNAHADLRALGLPASWARYSGTYVWSRNSVRNNPLYVRYEAKFTDGNIAHFLLTHPDRIVSIGQHAAKYAMHFRVTYLGNYSPIAGHPAGALENRVVVVTSLAKSISSSLGLWWLVSLWATLAVIALRAICLRRSSPWRRDGAVVVLCMTGCAVAAFIPPAFFDGVAIARHMVGSNLASVLAVLVGLALLVSLISQPANRIGRRVARRVGSKTPGRGSFTRPVRRSRRCPSGADPVGKPNACG